MSKHFERLWPETFRHAKTHSPFYRELFCNLTVAPPFEEIPTVDKTIVSARNLDFLCVPRESVLEIVTTSGTTGDPLLWMLTKSDLQRLATNEKLSFECAGLTSRDTVLVAVALDRCFIAGLAYSTGLRELGCAVVRVGPSSSLLILEMIARVQPTAIVAVPSFLRVIADKARETKFDLQNSSVKKLICIGEPVRERTLALNTVGRIIETAWNAKVFSTYGVTELANSLCECEAGAGGHLHDEQLHLEILDDAGEPLHEGEIGEIVATTFGVEGMPLIRYRTGDCAAMFFGTCRCGRKTPRLGPIIGRKQQKLKIKGASVFPSALQNILDEANGVDAYAIVATSENELCDEVEIFYHGAAQPKMLRETFQARAKITPQIRRASAEEIEKLQMPPHARKRQTFVDRRKKS
ncbi:MAG TPA: AMP-binding protein [Verrucomicrobiae bacterium]